MKSIKTPGAIKKFRRTPWRFQQTVERPLAERLDKFVRTIVNVHGGITEGSIIIDEIIFDSIRIAALLPSVSTAEIARDLSISAHTSDEMISLLVAAFMDGPDFVFIPTPKPFVFYADHDDWITFFANSTSNLNKVINPLESAGYTLVRGWERAL